MVTGPGRNLQPLFDLNNVRNPLVSILLPSLSIGGAERVLVELANQLTVNGWRVHLVVMSASGPMVDLICSDVELIDLRCQSFRQFTLSLSKYYATREPTIVLSSLYATGLSSIVARLFSRFKPKILIGAHNSLKAKIDHPDNMKDKWFLLLLCRLLFPLADGFIPVSKGLADELHQILRLPSSRFHPIYNPVVNLQLESLASEPVSHPWLINSSLRSYKTLVSVGRLVEQKAYDDLLHALFLARQSCDCRLIIIGGGPLLNKLKSLARQLGIYDYVDFIGWQVNPYKFLSHADLFVLSSRWEGLPTVLIEALACGCPVVSTNCKYGPEEILLGGKYGALTCVGDPADLSDKIISTCQVLPISPTRRAELVRRAHDFSVDASARHYVDYFYQIQNIIPNSNAHRT